MTNTIKASMVLGVSVILFTASIVFNTILASHFDWSFVFIVRAISIILALSYRAIIKNYKINVRYTVLILLILAPFFYKNAYFEDCSFKPVFDYFLTIIYTIAISNLTIHKRPISHFFLILVLGFAVITSFFTVLSLLLPKVYLDITKTLFSNEFFIQLSDGLKMQSLFGLTSHYSSNAFYMVIGVIFLIFSKDFKYKKTRIVLLALFSICLLLIGKRGHLLFLIISLLIGFVVIKKLSAKTILRIAAITTLLVMITILTIKIIPQANRTFERMAKESAADGDLSSGRLDMYEDAKKLYIKNNYMPIGWSQYAKSTNYLHPALHNDYIQLFYEVGVIGSLLVLIPNAYFLYMSYRKVRDEGTQLAKIVLIYNLFFVTYSITGLPRYDLEPYTVYFVVNTYLCLPTKKTEKKKNEE